MSDGMSDSHQLGRMATSLESAARELRDKIISTKEGYRGMTVSILPIVNDVLIGTGYRLVKTTYQDD